MCWLVVLVSFRMQGGWWWTLKISHICLLALCTSHQGTYSNTLRITCNPWPLSMPSLCALSRGSLLRTFILISIPKHSLLQVSIADILFCSPCFRISEILPKFCNDYVTSTFTKFLPTLKELAKLLKIDPRNLLSNEELIQKTQILFANVAKLIKSLFLFVC